MSFFTSLGGMKNAETDLRVISHNIANAETAGFKKSNAQFSDLVANGSANDPRRTPGIGAAVSSINQDFSLGPIEQTGRSLDVSINGGGFFATANPISGDLAFTRNGNFKIDAGGALQDANGDLVQAFPVDATGAVTSTTPANAVIPTTNGAGATLSSVSIDRNGLITAAYSDGTTEPVSAVALATFPATNGLRSIGQTKWEATGDSGTAVYGAPGIGNVGDLLSGTLERSNVDLAEEMVSLLTAQRNFQANARAIDTATAISQTVLNLQR
ncbi:flagellar hook-basal body protein [Erythrobacter crassostreae]|uniref:Flagellar hook protein FlgE n=1 Tax=Erythrobacter crassostreae TaxID=2828328 RepID=A0A9X1JKF5_9SPHN|nr:flagellar hook basal-body protein [Erythrobacter crassostrea]MBV7258911.1 flagellar hook basal-body protein [Erythrobacter crassostrea]